MVGVCFLRCFYRIWVGLYLSNLLIEIGLKFNIGFMSSFMKLLGDSWVRYGGIVLEGCW